ncbi:MAG: SH3 domain-containing protein [Candidatus Mariimomonas ferrooxydans]
MKRIILFNIVVLFIVFTTSSASALCVKALKANLRSGPGTNYERTWEVFKYFPFKKIGKKGNWYKVKDVDGDVHWIYKELITDKFDCAVVKLQVANVRSGPGTNFETKSFGPAVKYDSFKVLKRKGKWAKVIDEFGNKGWIYRNLLWIY